MIKTILRYKKITRDQLVKELGIKKSALVGYLNYLFECSLILETGIQSSSGGGRKPVFIELNPAYGNVISIAIEKNRLISGLIDLQGNVSSLLTEELPEIIEKETLLENMVNIIKRYSEAKERTAILGVTIAIGGSVDSASGMSLENLYIQNWSNIPLAEIISQKTGYKVKIIKDIEALAFGEFFFGNGIGLKHIIAINLGHDVGMGIIANGELYTGASSCAGELGHIIVDPNGPLCYCGRNGCLEKMVSVETLIEKCRDGLMHGVHSRVLKYTRENINNLSIESVIEAVNDNDVFTRKLIRDIGIYVGKKLSEIINLFNPEIICLRGSLINNNKFLYSQIKDYIFSHSRFYNLQNLQITYPCYEEYMALKGAAALIFLLLPLDFS
ncbi:ROK family protein [Treponema sp. HNW]|uniref:ROK family protein n=1 Tax=Treponema sp. HNW TaxID=3116654 RepID=UPI003D1501C3